jgi:hypothetical protein
VRKVAELAAHGLEGSATARRSGTDVVNACLREIIDGHLG